MTCETRLKKWQTAAQRIEEVRKVIGVLEKAIAAGRVKAVVGKQGAIAFAGLSEDERDGVSDACIYRRILVQGSPLAKAAIAKAEMLAGRTIDKQVIGAGTHSHDNGMTWHKGH
jgi:hypothetical protein